MLAIIESKKEILARIKSEMELEYTCEVVINIENEQTPAVVIEKKLIDFLHYVGAEVDIDTYVL